MLSVPYFEWDALGNAQKKQSYLAAKVQEVLKEHERKEKERKEKWMLSVSYDRSLDSNG